MSDEWRSDFSKFLSDMGKRTSRIHTLERLDTNGPYSKDNCAWRTMKEQQNNRRNNVRFEVNGQSMTMTQAAEEFGLTCAQVHNRLAMGWPISMALLIPLHAKKL